MLLGQHFAPAWQGFMTFPGPVSRRPGSKRPVAPSRAPPYPSPGDWHLGVLPGGPAWGPHWASGPGVASCRSRCGGQCWAGQAPPLRESPPPQPVHSVASEALPAAHAPPPASSPAPGPEPASEHHSAEPSGSSAPGEGQAWKLLKHLGSGVAVGLAQAPTWVSISCFFSLMRDMPEKSIVSVTRDGVSVWDPARPPNAAPRPPAVTSLFDLLLARLGGGHHVGGHHVDSAGALLQAAQVATVLVGLHLGECGGESGCRWPP